MILYENFRDDFAILPKNVYTIIYAWVTDGCWYNLKTLSHSNDETKTHRPNTKNSLLVLLTYTSFMHYHLLLTV